MSVEEWGVVRLTLLVAVAAVAVSLPVAVVVGWLLARRRFPGKFLVETAVNLPLVMPPVVTGYLLLMLLGRRGLLGGWLETWLGVRFVFDWKGAALASAVMGFPLLVRPIRQAFAAMDSQLLSAARTLGAGPLDVFTSIALPLALPGILGGCVIAFARSMGEFGATIMLAGSIPGETRTIPLYVYAQLDRPDGFPRSLPLIVVSIVLSAVAIVVSDRLERRGRERLAGEDAGRSS